MALGKISVDLDELVGGDGFDIRDAIVSRAVEEMTRQISGEIREGIKESISRRVAGHIDEKLDDLFQASMRPTDSWGNPRNGGESKTLAELVLKQAKDYLAEKVNSRGGTDPYSSSKPYTRAQWFVQQIAKEFVEKQFAAEVKQAQEEVRAQIGNRLGQAFKKAIADCAKS